MLITKSYRSLKSIRISCSTKLILRKLAMSATSTQIPKNEPVWEYRVNSKERGELEKALQKFYNQTTMVPIVIGDEEIHRTTDEIRYQLVPFEHSRKIAKFNHATKEDIVKAIDVAMAARPAWEALPLSERAAVMFKAADLTAGKYRQDLNAATMLGQGKTIVQAEIDSACELADFFRFNAHFALQLEQYKPISTDTYTDTMIYRGIDGFIGAVSPFNFTAIGGNLASAPALMGNVVLWKPSDTAVLANYLTFKLLREAGVPPGVINFIPSHGPDFGNTITDSKNFAGLNFTGSVPTFQKLCNQVSSKLATYTNFPRLIGECGGKNFHFVHPSADLDVVAPATIRGAFEYQGQKCSACSRMYVPESLWPKLREKLLAILGQVKVGSPLDHGTFMTAVIDQTSFKRIEEYINKAKSCKDCKIIAGGDCDMSKGYYIQPTIIETKNPNHVLMKEEIFGPVVTVYAYPDDQVNRTLDLVDSTTPFALTGAIFSQDKEFIRKALIVLRQAAGNLYVNDKCTGSIVGQQPFGGARMSGTNDKAGGPHYVLRWSSPLVIKESKARTVDWSYPSMQ